LNVGPLGAIWALADHRLPLERSGRFQLVWNPDRTNNRASQPEIDDQTCDVAQAASAARW